MSNNIVITCPVAEIPVRTGFKAPPGTSLAGLKRVAMHNCPACGKAHVWQGGDAYWEEDPPEPSFWADFLSIWRLRQT